MRRSLRGGTYFVASKPREASGVLRARGRDVEILDAADAGAARDQSVHERVTRSAEARDTPQTRHTHPWAAVSSRHGPYVTMLIMRLQLAQHARLFVLLPVLACVGIAGAGIRRRARARAGRSVRRALRAEPADRRDGQDHRRLVHGDDRIAAAAQAARRRGHAARGAAARRRDGLHEARTQDHHDQGWPVALDRARSELQAGARHLAGARPHRQIFRRQSRRRSCAGISRSPRARTRSAPAPIAST